MTTTVSPLIAEVVTILRADEWTPRWAKCQNALTDPYGNTFSIHEDRETIKVEFEYALPGMVETVYLNPSHGAARIARVIAALAAPTD